MLKSCTVLVATLVLLRRLDPWASLSHLLSCHRTYSEGHFCWLCAGNNPPMTDLLSRGVYQSRCLSPAGETILYAVTSKHCLLPNGWSYVAAGDNPHPTLEALWDRLEAEDPMALPDTLSEAS
jgi:hypothetical protein